MAARYIFGTQAPPSNCISLSLSLHPLSSSLLICSSTLRAHRHAASISRCLSREVPASQTSSSIYWYPSGHRRVPLQPPLHAPHPIPRAAQHHLAHTPRLHATHNVHQAHTYRTTASTAALLRTIHAPSTSITCSLIHQTLSSTSAVVHYLHYTPHCSSAVTITAICNPTLSDPPPTQAVASLHSVSIF